MTDVASLIGLLIVAGCILYAAASVVKALKTIAGLLEASARKQDDLLLHLTKVSDDKPLRDLARPEPEPAERFDPPDMISDDQARKNEEARERVRRFIEAKSGDAD